MLSREDNELLTRTGPGTPMGKLMRRYWIPALFCDQLSAPDDGCFDPAAVEVIKDSFIDMGQLSQRPTIDQLLTTRFVPVKP
jgi:phthalate 4,5-dioxygenase